MYFDEMQNNPRKHCSMMEDYFVVQWDGTIVPCCFLWDNQYTYGNIHETTPEELMGEVEILKAQIKQGTNEFCNHCFEKNMDFDIQYKAK